MARTEADWHHSPPVWLRQWASVTSRECYGPPREVSAVRIAPSRRARSERTRAYTPKHGSWLNMAESELSVLSGQCLDRRISDKPTLTEEVAAWEHSTSVCVLPEMPCRRECSRPGRRASH